MSSHLIKFNIHTKEELRLVVDKLLSAGNDFQRLRIFLGPNYQYHTNIFDFCTDIAYYGKASLRYQGNQFIQYL